jgi:hypothetical protein
MKMELCHLYKNFHANDIKFSVQQIKKLENILSPYFDKFL